MTRIAIAAVLSSVVLAVGCKGKTVVQEDPQMKNDLTHCQQSLAEKDKLIAALEAEKARLQTGGSLPTGDIVVTIEGDLLTVKPGKTGQGRPIDDKAVAEASREFTNLVRKSRGAIQKCYEQALKKNSGLQGRTVTLNVSAVFLPDGAHKSAAFSPSLGEPFDTCIRGVASKWSLGVKPPIPTFNAQVTLTPT